MCVWVYVVLMYGSAFSTFLLLACALFGQARGSWRDSNKVATILFAQPLASPFPQKLEELLRPPLTLVAGLDPSDEIT